MIPYHEGSRSKAWAYHSILGCTTHFKNVFLLDFDYLVSILSKSRTLRWCDDQKSARESECRRGYLTFLYCGQGYRDFSKTETLRVQWWWWNESSALTFLSNFCHGFRKLCICWKLSVELSKNGANKKSKNKSNQNEKTIQKNWITIFWF